jgi:hypothetical protein
MTIGEGPGKSYSHNALHLCKLACAPGIADEIIYIIHIHVVAHVEGETGKKVNA